MQSRLESLGPLAEAFHEAFSALANFLVRVWAAATAAGQPGSEASTLVTTKLEDRLIASRLIVVVFKLLIDSVLLTHEDRSIIKWLDLISSSHFEFISKNCEKWLRETILIIMIKAEGYL